MSVLKDVSLPDPENAWELVEGEVQKWVYSGFDRLNLTIIYIIHLKTESRVKQERLLPGRECCQPELVEGEVQKWVYSGFDRLNLTTIYIYILENRGDAW